MAVGVTLEEAKAYFKVGSVQYYEDPATGLEKPLTITAVEQVK
jgi:hypothetical protein